jgi:two-component system chemotaxis response regulator CheY
MQILVVDDSRMMRNMVIRAVKQAGYEDAEILEACDGVEALEVIAASGPDVVLCDWNMPRLNGIDVLKELRAAGDQRPFIFVTSEGAPGIEDTAREAGAHGLIVKPFGPADFATTLGRFSAETASA